MKIGSVIQFNENHKWCGSLGIITEVKEIHNDKLKGEGVNDTRFMIGVPIPQQGTAFIFVLDSEFAIEYIGEAILTAKKDDSEEGKENGK